MHFIQSKLEETIKHRVEDVLSCVNQTTQGLHEELTDISETQIDLQVVKTFIDMWTGSLQGDITDTRIFTRLENTRSDLHEELDLMFQVEA